MSDYEAYKGTLIPTKMTVNEYVTHRATEKFDNAEDFFNDNYWEEAFIIDGMVYEPELEQIDTEDLYMASRNDDGSIDILVNYYNGGSGLSDAIDTAIEYMKRDEK